MEDLERAVKALRNLESDRQSADGLQVQIQQLEADMITISEMGYIYPQGEKITPDKRMKALIDEKAGLLTREKAKRAHILHVERVLSSLSEPERAVLETFFCSNLKPGAATVKLEWQLHVRRSEVYRIRKWALWNFAYRMGYIQE